MPVNPTLAPATGEYDAMQARVQARLNAMLRALHGRDPRARYFRTPRGWMFYWTTEPMGDGKYASAVYVPHGPGSQSGKATRWRVSDEVHHTLRKAAKARALRLYRARLAEEATLRPVGKDR